MQCSIIFRVTSLAFSLTHKLTTYALDQIPMNNSILARINYLGTHCYSAECQDVKMQNLDVSTSNKWIQSVRCPSTLVWLIFSTRINIYSHCEAWWHLLDLSLQVRVGRSADTLKISLKLNSYRNNTFDDSYYLSNWDEMIWISLWCPCSVCRSDNNVLDVSLTSVSCLTELMLMSWDENLWCSPDIWLSNLLYFSS